VEPFFFVGSSDLRPTEEAIKPLRYHLLGKHIDGEMATDISCGEAAV
jgi:hypothetical protein